MTNKSKPIAAAPAPPAGKEEFSLISNEKLVALYAAMLRCRMLERYVRKLLKERQHTRGRASSSRETLLGHEASAAAIAIDLLPGDKLALCQGELIVPFVKGAPLERLLKTALAGKSRSVSAHRQALAALSTAQANKTRKNKKIVVSFCGQGTDALDAWQQTMRRASRARLPMLFVCLTDSGDADLAAQAEGFGFPGMVVDADDVVGIYRVASESIVHARRGNGPTLIVCTTACRTGAQDGDSIASMEAYLSRKKLFTPAMKAGIATKFRRALHAAEAAARTAGETAGLRRA